jgi:transcriptional regulator GlxA family with amidase domain
MSNAHYKRSKGLEEDLFKIDLVGLYREPVQYQGLFQVSPTKAINEIATTDLIIVTAISGDLEKQIQKNKAFIPWIRKQRIENDSEIASLCKGALLLAETGLLNGKSCATHWTVHDKFKQRYPQVNLIPEKIISEDKGIYSSGGAYSFLNFMLYLIEKYCGRETAIWCSKVSEIEFDRNDQGHFMIFQGQKEHNDSSIKKAQVFIEENYEIKLNIDEIARQFNISNRNFLRRFKKATSNTPLEYIQRVKIEAAKKRLESSTLNIQEVMYGVGYSDEKAFRSVFKKYTGLSPLAYRSKYNREMVFL